MYRKDWMEALNEELKTDYCWDRIQLLDLRRLVLAIKEIKKNKK